MQNKGRVITGIIIFLAIATLPFLYNSFSKQNNAPELNLNTPGIQQSGATQCIESTEYMRANHMELLSKWRDEVVRGGEKTYVNNRGESYDKSLDTCLDCHYDPNVTEDKQFCRECHIYASVQPDCRQCHTWPDVNEYNGENPHEPKQNETK